MKLQKRFSRKTFEDRIQEIPIFTYNGIQGSAYVTDVTDGDTITIVFKYYYSWLFYNRIKIKCRLFGINTPETRTKDLEEKQKGLAAKEYLRDMILHKKIGIQLGEFGSFGRTLATIYTKNSRKNNWENSINKHLIDVGHATVYVKNKKKARSKSV